MADQEPAGLKEQNEKVRNLLFFPPRRTFKNHNSRQRPSFRYQQFKDYKAPEKVYKKWTPNKTAQGKAFTGVSPSKL